MCLRPVTQSPPPAPVVPTAEVGQDRSAQGRSVFLARRRELSGKRNDSVFLFFPTQGHSDEMCKVEGGAAGSHAETGWGKGEEGSLDASSLACGGQEWSS